MKGTTFVSILIFATLIWLLSSCEDEDINEVKISSYGSNESHKMGQDCMNCHYQGGQGEGWFKIAGTVYEATKTSTYPNATVQLFTEPNGNGSLKYIIEVDNKGNFFSTSAIDFGGGLYTAVSGNNATSYMISAVTSGQCNSCHGNSADRIWTE